MSRLAVQATALVAGAFLAVLLLGGSGGQIAAPAAIEEKTVPAVRSAELLAFIDSDVRPHPAWLRELISPLTDPAIGLTTGLRSARTSLTYGMDTVSLRLARAAMPVPLMMPRLSVSTMLLKCG